VVYAAIGTMLVGHSEELLIRGLLIRGVRGSGAPEIGVFFASSIAFGLLHGINVLNRQSVRTTVIQVIFTAVFGGAMYTSRRRYRRPSPRTRSKMSRITLVTRSGSCSCT